VRTLLKPGTSYVCIVGRRLLGGGQQLGVRRRSVQVLVRPPLDGGVRVPLRRRRQPSEGGRRGAHRRRDGRRPRRRSADRLRRRRLRRGRRATTMATPGERRPN